MSLLKKLFFSFFLASAVFLIASPAFGVDDPTFGLDPSAKEAGLKEPKYDKPVPEIAGNVIGAALSLIAVLFFGLMIYGGFLWMTAHGKEDQTKKALEAITAALIGIIIVISAYAITRFVFRSVEGGELGDRGATQLANKCRWGKSVSPCKGKTADACPGGCTAATVDGEVWCMPTFVGLAVGGAGTGDPCIAFVEQNIGGDRDNEVIEKRLCETMDQHCQWQE